MPRKQAPTSVHPGGSLPPIGYIKSRAISRFHKEMLKMKVAPAMCMKTQGTMTTCHPKSRTFSAKLCQFHRKLETICRFAGMNLRRRVRFSGICGEPLWWCM